MVSKYFHGSSSSTNHTVRDIFSTLDHQSVQEVSTECYKLLINTIYTARAALLFTSKHCYKLPDMLLYKMLWWSFDPLTSVVWATRAACHFSSLCHTLQALATPGLPFLDYCQSCSQVGFRNNTGRTQTSFAYRRADYLRSFTLSGSRQVQLVHMHSKVIKRNEHFVNI